MTVNTLPRIRSANTVSGTTNGRSGPVLAALVTTLIDVAGQAAIAGLGLSLVLVMPFGLLR
ncbi:hypothetical protein ACW9HQ_52500 [Nocardia gipuzkoensis]